MGRSGKRKKKLDSLQATRQFIFAPDRESRESDLLREIRRARLAAIEAGATTATRNPKIVLDGQTLTGVDFRGLTFFNQEIHDAVLENCTFSDSDNRDLCANLNDLLLANSKIENCNFDDCQIRSAVWQGTTVEGSSFNYAVCDETDFSGQGTSQFVDCSFYNADLEEAQFEDSKFSLCQFIESQFSSGASFTGAAIRESVFQDLNLYQADFRGADLTGTQFLNCKLVDAQFSPEAEDQALFKDCLFAVEDEE